MSNPKKSDLVLKLTLDTCEHGHTQVTDAEIIEVDTLYEAPDAAATIGNSVGWTPLYGSNWARTFDDTSN